MDEINGSGLKYDHYQNFDTYWFINIDGDWNIRQKNDSIKN
jgi:hypothetical protein